MLSAYLGRRIELTATPHAPLTNRMGGAAVRFAAHAIEGIVRMG